MIWSKQLTRSEVSSSGAVSYWLVGIRKEELDADVRLRGGSRSVDLARKYNGGIGGSIIIQTQLGFLFFVLRIGTGRY